MKRTIGAAVLILALAACGGGEYDMENPPKWLKNVGRLMPSNALQPHELTGGCFARDVRGACEAFVTPSRSFVRNAVVRLVSGKEARLTYLPKEGNPVVVMIAPESDARVPVRRGGGTLRLECTVPTEAEGCRFALVTE